MAKKKPKHAADQDKLESYKHGADKAKELKALALRLRKANLKVEVIKDELKHAKAIAKGFQTALEDEAADADQPSPFPQTGKEKKAKAAAVRAKAAEPDKKPVDEMKLAV